MGRIDRFGRDLLRAKDYGCKAWSESAMFTGLGRMISRSILSVYEVTRALSADCLPRLGQQRQQ